MEKIYIVIYLLQTAFMFWGLISYLSKETSIISSISSVIFTLILIGVLYFIDKKNISNTKIVYVSYLIVFGIIKQIWFILKFYKTKSLTNKS